MRESWRLPHERIARAPENESGSGHSDKPDRVPLKEWLEIARRGELPPGPPDKAQGTKQKREFNAFVDEVALSRGAGVRASDREGFERSLRAYAQARVAGGDPSLAGAAAKFKLGKEDRVLFDGVREGLEAKLRELNITHESADQTPHIQAATRSVLENGGESEMSPKPEKPKPADAPQGRTAGLPDGWEEKLLREKDGTVLRVATDGTNVLRRRATDEDRARLASTLDDIKPEEMKAPAGPEQPKGRSDEPAETDEDVVDARSERISRESKKRKQEKKKKRAETSAKADGPLESAEERQKRLRDVAKVFFEKTEKGADPEFMYQLLENTLAQRDIDAFKVELKDEAEKGGMELEINGTKGENIRAFTEIAATRDEAESMLGKPDGGVGRIPYWQLPDRSIVVFDRPFKDMPAALLTIKEGGVHRFPDGWREYRDGAFHPVDWAVLEERREKAAAARRKAAPEPLAERSMPAEPPRAPAEAREPAAEEPAFDAARRIFLRKYHKEKMKAGRAFSEATNRLDVEEKLELVEELRDTTDIPDGILDGIASNLKHEAKKGGKQERGEKRLARDIADDIANIGSKPASAPVLRQERDGRESAQERLNREIAEDIARVLAKK